MPPFKDKNKQSYIMKYRFEQKLIQRTSQEVIFFVSSQFLQVLLDKEFLKIAEDNLKTQELLYEQIS